MWLWVSWWHWPWVSISSFLSFPSLSLFPELQRLLLHIAFLELRWLRRSFTFSLLLLRWLFLRSVGTCYSIHPPFLPSLLSVLSTKVVHQWEVPAIWRPVVVAACVCVCWVVLPFHFLCLLISHSLLWVWLSPLLGTWTVSTCSCVTLPSRKVHLVFAVHLRISCGFLWSHLWLLGWCCCRCRGNCALHIVLLGCVWGWHCICCRGFLTRGHLGPSHCRLGSVVICNRQKLVWWICCSFFYWSMLCIGAVHPPTTSHASTFRCLCWGTHLWHLGRRRLQLCLFSMLL